VSIDLGNLNSVELLEDQDEGEVTARVGSGARWGNVYAALEPFGLLPVGGRSAEVGVGGFILGGEASIWSWMKEEMLIGNRRYFSSLTTLRLGNRQCQKFRGMTHVIPSLSGKLTNKGCPRQRLNSKHQPRLTRPVLGPSRRRQQLRHRNAF